MSARRRWKRRPRPLAEPFTLPVGVTPRMLRRRLNDEVFRKHGLHIIGWEPLGNGGLTFLVGPIDTAVAATLTSDSTNGGR